MSLFFGLYVNIYTYIYIYIFLCYVFAVAGRKLGRNMAFRLNDTPFFVPNGV